MFYSFIHIVGVLLFKLLFRLRAKGEGNIPRKGGCILASNHMSYLDPMVLGIACPRRLCFLARSELFTHTSRAFAWLITALGAFPLKKGVGDLKALRTALALLREGGILVMFPEGTRTADGMLQRAEPGLGMLALKAGVPIIPTLIVGTDRALPRDARFIRLRRVGIYFGEKITPEELGAFERERQGYQKIADLVMERIAGLKRRIA